MGDRLRLGILQFTPAVGEIDQNLRHIERVARRPPSGTARSADLLLLPEMSLTGFDYPHLAELAAAALPALRDLATLLSPHAATVGLTIPAVTPRGITNRFVLIDIRGRILYAYDKIHRIGHGGFHETRFIAAGQHPLTFTKNGWRFGAAICYDLRFPELFRRMIHRHAKHRAPSARSSRPDGVVAPEVLLLPAQWPAIRQQALLSLARARAIENQAVFVLSNATGASGRLTFAGGSRVFGPTGEELLALGKGPGWGVVDVSQKALRAYRRSFPALQDTVLF